jgi:hypothetical protein
MGNTITDGVGGWTFTRDSGTQITITHPLGVPAVDVQTHAETSIGSGIYLSRTITGAGAGNYVSNRTVNFRIYGIGRTNIGGNGNHAYITWQFPSNTIFI